MIEELHRFIQVANNSSITQTAKKNFITQSALSQSIHRLEKELGTKLFVQKGKQLSLTEDGKSILQLSNKILELWETAKDKKKRQTLRPTYTIGAFDNGALRLGKYFQKITHDKTIHLELIINNSEKLLQQLKLGIVDVAICVIDPQEKTDQNILLVQTFSETLIPVSVEKRKEPITTIPFLLYNKTSHTRKQIDELFFKKNITPTIFAESTSVPFMKELAILGCGVALLPENEVKTEMQQKLLKKQTLPFTIKRTFGLYIKKYGAVHKDNPLINDLIYNLK
ncbi:MAG TPA: LysR family transcriptional regulator [Patescibacteria group bacterium]|nr:LysR family transcriptional regulator [Patescibacteria group bacterium]